MNISPVKKRSTLDCAIDTIRDYILENKLEKGSILPPETQLASHLGISRNILREAMRHYRTLGVIDSKPKTGAFIAHIFPENPYEGYLPFIAARKNSLRELAEIRYSIETGAAPIIAKAITREQIAELEILCHKMEQADNNEKFILDLEFHKKILHAANNRLLDSLIPLMVGFFHTLQKQSRKLKHFRDPHDINREHRKIVNAFAAGDAETATKLLKKHSSCYLEQLVR